jgi:hypothetical protein
MKWINWIEPWGPNSEPIYIRAQVETVIAKMKANFPERNYTDQQALDEFVVVNWAYITEDIGNADVYHEGTKKFYNAQLLRKLTLEEFLGPNF